MKTANLVLGIILIVAALFAGSYSLFTTCSNSSITQAMLGIPSCSSLLAVGAIGVVMLVIGIIVLAVGGDKGTGTAPPSQPPLTFYPPAQPPYHPPPPVLTPPRASGQTFCPTCGAHYPADYKVCPRDATELKRLQ